MSPAEQDLALRQGALALGLNLSETVRGRLLAYLGLLLKWNKVYNLTALREPDQVLTHHLLDSLSLLPPLLRHTRGQPTQVLDVGSGGGLPGVVLAICQPEMEITCVDAVAKKTAFVQQVAGALSLPNLHAVHSRVENLTGQWPWITSRAFATLADFVRCSASVRAPGGQWLAMKGKTPDAELAELPQDIAVFHVEPLSVPGLAAQRCLVWMGSKKP
jgi:16S rRNA (guanine527-N7)-methyltransferase